MYLVWLKYNTLPIMELSVSGKNSLELVISSDVPDDIGGVMQISLNPESVPV